MPAAWDMGDQILIGFMDQYVSAYFGESGKMFLYKNDYTPVPGAALDDFEDADFPGADYQVIDNANWFPATVTDHVATKLYNVELTFTGEAGSWTPQLIYGYYAIDWNNDYWFSERFSTPIEIGPDGFIKVTPRWRHKTITG